MIGAKYIPVPSAAKPGKQMVILYKETHVIINNGDFSTLLHNNSK